MNSDACTVPAGERVETQPATIWSILAIQNHALNLSNAAAEPFEAAGGQRKVCTKEEQGSNQREGSRANGTRVYLMPSDVCLWLSRPACGGAVNTEALGDGEQMWCHSAPFDL